MNTDLQQRARRHKELIRIGLAVKGHTFRYAGADLEYVDDIHIDLEVKEQGSDGGHRRYGNSKLYLTFGVRWIRNPPKRKTYKERKDQTFNVVKIVEAIEAHLQERVEIDKRRADDNDSYQAWSEAETRVQEAVDDYFNSPGSVSATSRGLGLKFYDLTEEQAKAVLRAAKEIIGPDPEDDEPAAKPKTRYQRLMT